MDVQIKDMPAFRVAAVAHIGPYNQIWEAFARLGKIAGEAQLFGPQAAMIGIYYDDPETTPAADLRSDAAIVISEATPLPAGVVERRLPAGRYASTTFVGPYERLGDTWARFMGEWLPRSGQRLSNGASYEVYRNTPNDVPPEKLVTELYAPLES